MSRFSRKEILDRLNKKRAAKQPIIIGAGGIGLIAKAADKAGIDLIMSYCTGPVRMNGNSGQLGYMGYVDSNGVTLRMGHMIIDRVRNTPMVGGVGVADPYRDIDRLIEELMEIGFSGVTNVPTVGGHSGALRQLMEDNGVGFNGEVKLVENCSKRDIFTIAYAFDEDQTRKMVAAGTDIICPHVGVTGDKSIQYKTMLTVDQAAEKINRLYDVAVAENPDVIVACHGGPFVDPESVQRGFDLTRAQAFVGASTVERIPVENAIYEAVGRFSRLKLGVG
jgi:predicted TIM-barrel enzyme